MKAMGAGIAEEGDGVPYVKPGAAEKAQGALATDSALTAAGAYDDAAPCKPGTDCAGKDAAAIKGKSLSDIDGAIDSLEKREVELRAQRQAVLAQTEKSSV